MKMTLRLLLSAVLLVGAVRLGHAQDTASQAGADPALTQQADPALVKQVPADMKGKPFTLAVALGSPPDDFRNDKGE
ncbi:MAG: hypothetical protein J0H57_25865, partial [Rhodospirillales bacterium]|nr:hypothetical protein [Rhodospirillales bacterium]